MARIATSIEESKRLLELGIDPNTADMSYDWIGGKVYDLCLAPCVNEMDIPAWSLGALLDICPYDRDVYFDRNGHGIWIDTELTTMPFDVDYIGAVVKTIELLVNEGYIKTKEE